MEKPSHNSNGFEDGTSTSPLPLKTPSVHHLPFIDGLRGAAALYVVLFHCLGYLPKTTPENSSSAMETLNWILGRGHSAVTVFIVLSGFCLMLPVAKNGELRGGALQFFKRRARRILPPYYCAVALSLALISTVIGKKTGTLWDITIPVTLNDIWAHLFLVQDLFLLNGNTINHSLWSISVEYRIYFLFPLILMAAKKWGMLGIVSLILPLFLAIQHCLQFTGLNYQSWGICVHYVGMFALGMLACEVSLSPNAEYEFRDRIVWWKAAWICFAAGLLLARFEPDLNFYLFDLVAAFWAFSLLISLTREPPNCISKILSGRMLSFIGTFAYSIYLIHAPILQLTTQYVVRPLPMSWAQAVFSTFILGVGFAVGAAYLFYLCCERPFITSRAK